MTSLALDSIDLTPLWLVLWTLAGLGAGLALDRAASWVNRQHPGHPAIARRTIWMALVTGLLFGLAGWRFGPSLRAVLVSIYVAVLVLITATDLEQRIIPNAAILPAILLAAVAGFFATWMTWKAALLGGLTGLLLFAIAYGLAAALYPGKIALGMGDVTLATFIGLAVGFPQAIVALFLGVLLGGLVSALLLVSRRATLRTAIPYGPFLVLGGLVALYWGEAIIKWYFRM